MGPGSELGAVGGSTPPIGPTPLIGSVAGLPALGRGKHATPTGGACLMEYTALLAGQRFSDRPGCTHPALAELARQVNDRLDDTARPQLVTRAPVLAGLGPEVPGLSAAVGAAAVDTCVRLAPASLAGPWRGWRLRGLRDRDTAGRSRWGRRRDTATARALLLAALDHVEFLGRGTTREDALLGLLDRALLLAPHLTRADATPAGTPCGARCPSDLRCERPRGAPTGPAQGLGVRS